MGEEVTACEVLNQGLVDPGLGKVEVFDILGERQLGDGHLVLDRASLSASTVPG